MLPLVVVVDFDGTITLKDIGDEVCERFADPTLGSWRDIDAAWVRGELSLPNAQERMWALTRAERAEAVAFARQVGQPRAGLKALLDAVERRGGEVWLASGGFDFYIDALLGELRPRFARAYMNTARFGDGRIAVSFPHDELACTRCAICKGKVCAAAATVAERVVFVGDGASDRCVLALAEPTIWAVAGGLLEQAAVDQGRPVQSFTDFAVLAAGL